MIKLTDLKPNERNPRAIRKDKLDKLKKSIQDFERMLELRPIIIDESAVILGGNMRYQALKALGYKELKPEWVKQVHDLTEAQKKEFIIKDNVGFGEWDWEALANDWDMSDLENWGMEIPSWEEEEQEKEEDNTKSDSICPTCKQNV